MLGCAIVPSYRVELEDANRIVLSYFDDPTDASRSREVSAMAGAHCDRQGKSATLVRSTLRTTDYRTEAVYHCR